MSQTNKVFEPVEAIVHFNNKKVRILRFKWKNDVYKVTEMLQSWDIPSGDNFSTHYVVICEDKNIMCELSLNFKDRKWNCELVQWDTLWELFYEISQRYYLSEVRPKHYFYIYRNFCKVRQIHGEFYFQIIIPLHLWDSFS